MNRKSAPSQSPEKKEKDPKKIELAKHVLSGLGQALRKLALYLHQKDGADEFFKSTLADLQTFQQSYGNMTLVVKPFDFLFEGEPIFQADNQENSVTYKLYNAGIRSLTLEKGIQSRDLVALGRVFLKTPMELQEDDLASLLWREGIPHVSYLQIQSTEEDDEEDVDGSDDIEQVYAFIKEKFSAKDARHKVNFRSFSSADTQLDSFFQRSHTQRQLFDLPKPASAAEVAYIRDVLRQEQEQLFLRGSELLYFLCKQADDPNALQDLEDTFVLLCEGLFFAHDFAHLAKLLDAMDRLAVEARQRKGKAFLTLKRKLHEELASEERFQYLLDYLGSILSLREEERNDLCIFLQILGEPLHERMLQCLPSVTPLARRLFLLVLLGSTRTPATLAQTLFEQFGANKEARKDLISDLLQVGRELPGVLTRAQLQTFLEDPDGQLQKLALSVLIEQFPEEISNVTGGFFKHARSGVLRTLFEVLCTSSEKGLGMLHEFIQSKRFLQMEEDDQSALFVILGRSQKPEYLAWFREILGSKSRLFFPAIDRKKRLAIRGLEAFGTFDARDLLQGQVHCDHHSRRIKEEIAHSLTFYNLYLKAPGTSTTKKAEDHFSKRP